MFAVKQACKSVIQTNIRHTHKTSLKFDFLNEKIKNNVTQFLKEHNIKNFTMTLSYNQDQLDYTGTIYSEHFTKKEIEQISNDNELNYYIKMSNEFAIKN